MYLKLLKTFISKNFSRFFLIIFCISLSLTGFLVSDNLVNNIQRLIGNEAKPILWWDIKLEWSWNLSEEQISYLDDLQSNWQIDFTEKIQTFSTITDKFWEPQLVSLVFVEDNFPLYWDYIVEERSIEGIGYAASQSVIDILEQDGWLSLFNKEYKTAGVIEEFPGASLNFFDEGKQVVLPKSEFQALWIDQLWSRLEREYLVKVNDPNNFDTILESITKNSLFSDIRIRDYKRWGDRFEQIFWELDNYIKYIVIVTFLLTILIIFLSVESFYIWNKKNFAILQILWLRTKKFFLFNISLFFWVFLVSFIISIILWYIIFWYIRTFELAADFTIIPSSLIEIWILGIIVLWISVIIPLLKFFSHSPLAGLKENFLQVYTKKEVFFQILLVTIWLISIYTIWIGSFKSAVIFTSFFLGAIFILSLVYSLILKLVYKIFKNTKNISFNIYDSIRNTIKPWNLSLLISWSFLKSFTILLFISTLSSSFLDTLNIDLTNNKNVYVINIPDEDIDKIEEPYRSDTFSVILARISQINETDLSDHLAWKRGTWRYTREFNITDNALESVEILEGRKIKQWEVSIDYDFAQSIGIEVSDEVEFLVYWLKKTLTVVNTRNSTRSQIEPFFYFQVHPDDFKGFPKNHFLSTYVDPDKVNAFKKNLLANTGEYISFIEVEDIIEQVQSISRKVLIVIQILFSYVFIFCIISLIISILFLVPFKQKKSKLYHTLWASRKFIKANNSTEYYYLQFLATLISIIIATWLSYLILGQSDFINFSLSSYSKALWLLLFISLLIVILIHLIVSKINVSSEKS